MKNSVAIFNINVKPATTSNCIIHHNLTVLIKRKPNPEHKKNGSTK